MGGDQIRFEEKSVLSKGYGIVPKLIMLDKRLSIESKAIYSYMCSFAGNGSSAFPSVKRIIADLGIGEKRFYKYRKLLVEYGYMEIIEKRVGNRRGNNTYVLKQMVNSEHGQNVGDNNNSILNNNIINNNNIQKEKECPLMEDGTEPWNDNERVREKAIGVEQR